MKRMTWWVAIGLGCVIGIGGVWLRSRLEQARLREAIKQMHTRSLEKTAISENSGPPASSHSTLAEQQRLREDHEEVARLRREIEMLKQRVAERARARIAREQAQRTAPPLPERSISEEMLPADLWRNRGCATPSNTMETALWAAAGGDVVALAQMLKLEPAARAKAAALLAGLPEMIRAQCATPEQLVALLGANDVPLGQAQIFEPSMPAGAGTFRLARISAEPGKIKHTLIALEREGDAWRLVVPESAIDRYAAKLKAPGP